jgi:glycerol-3-phosphate dehydrogenase
VIGGGVVGCAVARELAKWKVSVVLVEKEYDAAVHT